MHSELSYGLSIAPKLQHVGSLPLPGQDQPTPDLDYLAPLKKLLFPRPKNENSRPHIDIETVSF